MCVNKGLSELNYSWINDLLNLKIWNLEKILTRFVRKKKENYARNEMQILVVAVL